MSCIFEFFKYRLYNSDYIDEINKDMQYILFIKDTIACPNLKKILDGFRFPKNKYKEYIKILLGSRISRKSVSLANIRQIYILTFH